MDSLNAESFVSGGCLANSWRFLKDGHYYDGQNIRKVVETLIESKTGAKSTTFLMILNKWDIGLYIQWQQI